MAQDSNPNRELWTALERLAAVASIFIIVILSYVYFQAPSWSRLTPEFQEFIQNLIVNLIPVYILFVVSYFLLRRIQIIRSKEDRKSLAGNIAEDIHKLLLTHSGRLSHEVQVYSSDKRIIKQRSDITTANIQLIGQAKQNVISFSGDLSWTMHCHDALLDAVKHNISIRILCKDPLTEEAKNHVKRYFLQPGIDIKYYPRGFDPDIRGLMADSSTTRNALFVEKKHKTLGDNYLRTGESGDSRTYEYWGQQFDTEHDLAIVSPLSKLFDVLWEQAQESDVFYRGEWHDVEYGLRKIPLYQNTRMSIRTVKIANLYPLHRYIDEREYNRIRYLAEKFEKHNVPLWHVVSIHSQSGKKLVCPPIIEIHANKWIIVDGLARAHLLRNRGADSMVACVIEDVDQPLPGDEWLWGQVRIVSHSNYSKDDNFLNFDAKYWRNLDLLHSALEHINV